MSIVNTSGIVLLIALGLALWLTVACSTPLPTPTPTHVPPPPIYTSTIEWQTATPTPLSISYVNTTEGVVIRLMQYPKHTAMRFTATAQQATAIAAVVAKVYATIRADATAPTGFPKNEISLNPSETDRFFELLNENTATETTKGK